MVYRMDDMVYTFFMVFIYLFTPTIPIELNENEKPPCEVFRAENDPNRIDACRRLGSVVRGSDGPV